MPFNLHIFRIRTLTAVVFALIMLSGLILNGTAFLILFTLVHFGCFYEFVKLLKKITPSDYISRLPLGVLYITLPIILFFNLGFPSSFLYLTSHEHGSLEWPLEYSRILPCFIIFSIWVNDTMAYLVGSLIGKTPLSPVSPRKTWEGTVGGAIICVAVISIVSWWQQFLPLKDAIIISSICALFGTLGDLLESKLKRMAKVKDSGSILPGHGGFLDRFDSFLIATPVLWIYLYFST